jgi:hypothetical protein
MKFLSDIRLLLTGLWLGAAVFFIAVAQSAFAVLPTREAAGSVVSRTLMIINISGLIIGLVLLATSFIKQNGIKPVWIWTERVLLVILTLACAAGQFVIGLWLAFVHAQMGGRPIDEVPLEDPLRMQFNTLHQYSVWVLVAAMIAALLAFFIISRKNFTITEKKVSKDFDFKTDFKI